MIGNTLVMIFNLYSHNTEALNIDKQEYLRRIKIIVVAIIKKFDQSIGMPITNECQFCTFICHWNFFPD
ncbi:hypothetical protein T03_640 [Trichinella britovi]|uniref:Uncharacterized protein n=1 Tax=Trichinella britovi TaxID=45882 RepID=A0A0V1D886_TRIBR|nr:hypothetical protein T03_640 [Trichinella britovi]